MSKARKRKGLFFTMELKPYRFGVAFSIGQDREALDKDLKDLDRKFNTNAREAILIDYDRIEPISSGFVLSVGKNEGDAFVWLRDIPTTNGTCGVAIHEFMHLVTLCLHGRGMELGSTASSQEPYCYLMEEVWNEVMGRVSQHRK